MSQIQHSSKQHLKQKFCLCLPVDRFETYPGGQATFYGGDKFTVLFGKDVSTLDVLIIIIKKI